MTKKDLKAFAQIMAVMNEAFGNPDRQVSNLMMDFYFKALQDMSIEDLNEAAVRLAQTKTIRTFPTPGEIRQALVGDKEAQALIAWNEFIHAVRSLGPYKSVVFEDTTTMAVVQAMGGWIKFGDYTTEEMKWKQKEFMGMYSAFHGRNLSAPEILPGIHEQTNFALGYRDYIQEPVRIGKGKQTFLGQSKPRALKEKNE